MYNSNRIILIASLFLLSITAFAQDKIIEVTINKATSITFPSNIIEGIKISRDVLSQRPKGVDNVILLTAKKPKFRETNLTVFTGDRKQYQFTVRFVEQPATFNIDIAESDQLDANLHLTSEMSKTELRNYSEKIIAEPTRFPQRSVKNFGMTLTLRAVYIERDIMFYRLQVDNTTNISYHPETIRLYIKDKRQTKRTGSQEIQKKPIYKHGNTDLISGNSSATMVFAIPKFTIPDAKLLNIEIMEHDGGRHLKLKVKNNLIVKALTLTP